jgi:hypothetical protein
MNAVNTRTMREARRGGGGTRPENKSRFNGETFKGLVEDLETKRVPLKKIVLSDDRQVGLSVIIRDTGTISYHVQYELPDARPQLKIGNYPDMSVERARNIASTIVALARKGIDVQSGLHDRLIRELEQRGEKWKAE